MKHNLDYYFNYENILDHFAKDWNTKDVNGFVFDKEFQINDVPVSWFLDRFFAVNNIPSTFNILNILHENYMLKKELNPIKKIYYKTLSKTLSKFLLFNEKRKINLRNKKLEENKILFLTYTNHIPNFKDDSSIFRLGKLISLTEDNLVVVCDTMSNVKTSKFKEIDHMIYDFVDEESMKIADKISTELNTKWNTINKKEIFGDLYSYIEHALNFFMSKEFLYLIVLYYNVVNKLLINQKASVLSSHNSLYERCIMMASHKLNKPCYIIQHGTGAGTANPNATESTKFLVFSDMYKKRLMSFGITEKNIEIVGPIIFDEINSFIGKSKPSNQILLVTEPFVERNMLDEGFYFESIKKILLSIPINIQVKIKMHPSEKLYDKYVKLIKECSLSNVEIINQVGVNVLYEAINNSNIIIEFGSTVAIEAMILDKPVITINLSSGTGNYEIIKKSKATMEIEIDNLTISIKELMTDDSLVEKRKKAVESICGKIDGNASKRAIDIITKKTL